MKRRIACVLVHHDNLGELPDTVSAIIDQGLDAQDVLIVDNSGDKVSERELNGVLPSGVVAERIHNRGYGNAVNTGVDLLFGRELPPQYILVVTHEVRPQQEAVLRLVEALESHPEFIAAGPALHTQLKGGGEWIATGGSETRILGIPRHVVSAFREGGEIVERSWLDGAFVLYRREAFARERFREDFFLYVEETEYHYRLRGEGNKIGCVPVAQVSERANDVPARFQGRNLQWLLDLHGRPWQRWLAVPWVIGKAAVKALLGRKPWIEVRELWFGWREAHQRPIRDPKSK